MSRSTSTGMLAAILVLAASCVSSRTPSGGGEAFGSTLLSDTELRIVYSARELPPYRSAFVALCHCAELALDRGFRYLRIDDLERLGPGEAQWTLRLFQVPPEGAVLLDVAEPTWEGDSPAAGVLAAGSYAAACRKRLTNQDTPAPR